MLDMRKAPDGDVRLSSTASPLRGLHRLPHRNFLTMTRPSASFLPIFDGYKLTRARLQVELRARLSPKDQAKLSAKGLMRTCMSGVSSSSSWHELYAGMNRWRLQPLTKKQMIDQCDEGQGRETTSGR